MNAIAAYESENTKIGVIATYSSANLIRVISLSHTIPTGPTVTEPDPLSSHYTHLKCGASCQPLMCVKGLWFRRGVEHVTRAQYNMVIANIFKLGAN